MGDRTCTVVFNDGTPCKSQIRYPTRGLCMSCYMWSWIRDGAEPMGRSRPRGRGERHSRLVAAAKATTDECIILEGFTGRPNAWLDGRRMTAARAVWIIAHDGEDPGEHWVLHTCNGGSGDHGCINIRHLYLGDHGQNMVDMVEGGHSLRGRTDLRGTGNGAAKIIEDQAREIRDRYFPGRPRHPGNKAALAAEFGVTERTIEAIVERRAWKHV